MELDDETLEQLGRGDLFTAMIWSERAAYLRARRLESQRTYNTSERGKSSNRRHNMTAERKALKVASEMRYQKSAKGQRTLKKAHAKYAKTAKGIASRKRAQAAYAARQKAKNK